MAFSQDAADRRREQAAAAPSRDTSDRDTAERSARIERMWAQALAGWGFDDTFDAERATAGEGEV